MKNARDSQTLFFQQIILPKIAALLPAGEACYLVGGAVRDTMLQRSGRDFDFTMAGDPSTLVRKLAEDLAGHWFFLDEPRRQSRVLINWKDEEIICDFTPFRATTLEGDLRLRDFTLNAMAMPVLKSGSLGALFDPLNGRDDLRKGQLRICSPLVLQMDPLRILKGIRHCTSHDLSIEQITLQTMRRDCNGLLNTSPERVRDELSGILASQRAVRGLRLLSELGLIVFLFGAPGNHSCFQQGLKYLSAIDDWQEALLGAPAERIIQSLEFEIEPGFSRAAALKLAAFLRGYGVSHSSIILKKWRTSRRLQATVETLTMLSSDSFKAFLTVQGGPRGRALWLESLGGDAEACALFLAIFSDREGRHKIGLATKFLHDLDSSRHQGRIPDLVAGSWIKEKLGFREGPEIGKALTALRREEMAGRIENRLDAEAFLAAYKEKND